MKNIATNNFTSTNSKDCHLNKLILEDDIRESMKRDLPNWLQSFLTHVTANPYHGEKPRQRTALNHVWITFIALIMGVCITSFAVLQSDFYLLLIPLGWSLTIHGSRKLRLTVMHACSHHAIFQNRKFDSWLGLFISVLTLTLNFKVYQRGHIKTHHSKNLLLPGDETYIYLIDTVGFRLGMTVDEAWRHLFKTLISPAFYIRRFCFRLRKSFFSDCWRYNALSIAFWVGILVIITMTNSCLIFLIAWVIPLPIFFEVSSLLRQCVEHRFPGTNERSPEILQQMTVAIFCGESTPRP